MSQQAPESSTASSSMFKPLVELFKYFIGGISQESSIESNLEPLVAPSNNIQKKEHSKLSRVKHSEPVLMSLSAPCVPGRSLALTLSNYSSDTLHTVERFFYVKSLQHLKLIHLPLMQIQGNLGVVSKKNYETLTLPEVVNGNIRVLFIIVEFDISGWCSALAQLAHCLENVETLVIEARLNENSNLFVFDLKVVSYKIEAIKYALEHIPICCHSEKRTMDGYLEKCLHNPFQFQLAEAVLVFSPSLMEKYGTLSWIHWSLREYTPIMLHSDHIVDIMNLSTLGPHVFPTVLLDQFPNLCTLKTNTTVESLNGNKCTFLRVFHWKPFLSASLSLCPIHLMPNLQRLELYCSITYDIPLELKHCPHLQYLSLRHVNRLSVVNMSGIPFAFKKLYLHYFKGSIQGAENITIDTFSFNLELTEAVLYQMYQKAATFEVTADRDRPDTKCYHQAFHHMKALTYHGDSSGKNSLRGVYRFNLLGSVFLVTRLELSLCYLTLTPSLFPNIKKLTLIRCSFRLEYENEENLHDSEGFQHLTYLRISDSGVFWPSNENSPVSCYLKAPMLKTLDLSTAAPGNSILLNSQSCSALKHFYYCEIDKVSDLPFDYHRAQGPLFPELLDFHFEMPNAKRNVFSLDLEKIFSVDRIATFELLGGIIINNSDELRMSCHYANISSRVLGVNHGKTKEDLMVMAFSMMPMMRVLVMDEQVLVYSLNTAPKMIEIKGEEERKPDSDEESDHRIVNQHKAAVNDALCDGFPITSCRW